MTVTFTLNGVRVTSACDPADRAVDVLREEFGQTGAVAGCYAGICGTCVILVDDELLYGCLTPMFSIHDRRIETIDGISQTETYQEISRSFREDGTTPCRLCFQGKVLSVYQLLKRAVQPDAHEIDEYLRVHRCRCTDTIELVSMVIRIGANRQERRRGDRG